MTQHLPPQEGTDPPYSPAVLAGGFVFVSGQASTDALGTIVSGTFEEEFRRSMDNVDRVLAEADASRPDVVQVRAYVRDPADLDEYNRLYREYFQAPRPARTTLTCCLPDTLRFEIEAIAVVG